MISPMRKKTCRHTYTVMHKNIIPGFAWLYTFLWIACCNVGQVSSQCGGSASTVNVGITSGSFTYPASGQYGANENCEWLLTSGGAVILYRIVDVAIDTSDGLSLYDGNSASATVIETNINTAGSVFSKPIGTSSGQNLFFKFTSDASAESNGFTVNYISSADTSSCSSSGASTALTATTSDQAITSPGFPGTYQLDWNCEWVVSPSDSTYYVTVDFQFLDNDLFNSQCFDKITVTYNDGSAQSAEPCGSDNFSPTNSYSASAGNSITIKFESDGTQVERGFVAVYRQTAVTTTSTSTEATTDTSTTEETISSSSLSSTLSSTSSSTFTTETISSSSLSSTLSSTSSSTSTTETLSSSSLSSTLSSTSSSTSTTETTSTLLFSSLSSASSSTSTIEVTSTATETTMTTTEATTMETTELSTASAPVSTTLTSTEVTFPNPTTANTQAATEASTQNFLPENMTQKAFVMAFGLVLGYFFIVILITILLVYFLCLRKRNEGRKLIKNRGMREDSKVYTNGQLADNDLKGFTFYRGTI